MYVPIFNFYIMALVQSIKQGDKSPTLYTFRGKQYDFDQLEQDLNDGINDYIASLSKGEKNREKLLEAYYNMKEGIRDGSITFSDKDNRYLDSKGRYSNSSSKPSKDHYGLIANYIFGKQRKQTEYTPPEEASKIKWEGSSSIGKAVTRNIFNSDTWNQQDFLDLNEYDDSGNIVGTNKGLEKIHSALTDIYNNYDTYFSGYTDQDKQKILNYLSSAISKIKDNKIDPGDYLALRAATGLDFNEILSSKPTQNTPIDFYPWIISTHPVAQDMAEPKDLKDSNSYATVSVKKLLDTVSSLDENALSQTVLAYIADTNGEYNFNKWGYIARAFDNEPQYFSNQLGTRVALEAMKSKNLLKPLGDQYPNLYYIPKSDNTNRETSWIWDSQNNILKEVSWHDIPWKREEFVSEWAQKNSPGNNPYYISRYNGFFKKEGGKIIKAQLGVKLGNNANYYTGVFLPQLDHILTGLEKDQDYYKWLNTMQDKHSSIYSAAGENFLNKAYKSDTVGEYQNLYKTGYNNEWKDNPMGYNSLGIANAQKLGMFDISGGNRISGDWEGKWTTDKLFSGITDYRRLLGRVGDFNDDQLADIKNKFKEKGYDFIRGDDDYYRLLPAMDLTPKIELDTKSPTQEELTKQVDTKSILDPTGKSSINPVQENHNPKNSSLNYIAPLAKLGVSAGNLFNFLRTTRKNRDLLKDVIKPDIKNTYELYSPVTGAFDIQSFYNTVAAGRRRRANQMLFSDISQYLANQSEENTKAIEDEVKGALADNAEIKRTKQESLKRVEDNIKRRTDTANDNRASINRSSLLKAQIDAQANNLKYDAISRAMKEQLENLTSWIEDAKNKRTQARLGLIEDQSRDVASRAKQAALSWKADPNNKGKSLIQYKDYTDFLNELSNWKLYQIDRANGINYKSKYSNDSAYNIASKYGFFKDGGQLKPSILQAINKIIKK